MKKFKTAAVFPLLIITMIMSVACASDRVEETVATTTQVEENVEQPKQEAVAETTQTESIATDNAEQEQTEADPKYEVDEWVKVLDTLVPANGKKYDFLGSKWGDSMDDVKKAMGKEPDATRGDSQVGYYYPIFDYDTMLSIDVRDFGFSDANIIIREKSKDEQMKLLNPMNKAAAQLYGDPIEQINGRIVYETKTSHVELRRTNETVEIYVNDINFVDDPNPQLFKGVSYTVD